MLEIEADVGILVIGEAPDIIEVEVELDPLDATEINGPIELDPSPIREPDVPDVVDGVKLAFAEIFVEDEDEGAIEMTPDREVLLPLEGQIAGDGVGIGCGNIGCGW